MPIEPPPPPWLLPDVRLARPGEELVAIGAELTPGMLVAGYRAGMFPMPEPGLLGWWSPDPRGVLWPAQVRVARSLRRSLRRYEVSLDTCFAEVVAGCADPRRPQGWNTAEYRAAYEDLFALGWAHSLEVWDATGRLVGGLFGVELGGLFAAESKFHRSTDASKVAVVALADLLAADGHPDRLVDVQWRTEHLARLGVVEVRRVEYLRLAARARALPPVLAGQAVPAGPSRIRWRAA